MNTLKISDLTIHPKNDYYFDDVSGEKWERLLESIKANGVRTPIIVTDDMRVVSGNQRVRACKELGISVINAEIVHYANEDDVIRDLIEINIRQRGVIDDSEIKQGRRFKFLNEYYGVHNGGVHGESLPNYSEVKTQEQIASESGISVDTMKNLMKLTEMIPEMQDLLDTGVVSKTTALSIIKQLPEDEQKQLADKIADSSKVSGKEVQNYIDEIKSVKAENNKLRSALSESEAKRIQAEQNVKEVIKEVEIIPDDYVEYKKKAKLASSYENDYKREREKVNEEKRKNLELQNKIDELKLQTAQATTSAKLIEGSIYFVAQCGSFVRDMGGYIWIADKIAELPDGERVNFVKAVKAIHDWAEILQQNIERNM